MGVSMQVVDLGDAKGWGVVAAEAIPAGAYVCEYAGEVVTLADAQRRWQAHAAAGVDSASDSTYVLCVREHRG
jgi:hypothetical protein